MNSQEYSNALDATLKQGDVLTEVSNNKKTYDKKGEEIKSVIDPNSSYSEPATPFDPKYPYNNAKSSESGHVLEFDDTPGAERVSLSHRSGTFFEIHPDGSKVEKIYNDNVQVILKDNQIYIMGNNQETVQGSVKIYIKGSAKLQVDGDVEVQVGGNMIMNVDGSFTAKAENFNFIGDINQVGSFNNTGNILTQGNIAAEKSINANLDLIAKRNALISGYETVGSTITAGGDVTGAGISLDHHTHGGVASGPSSTGQPQ